MRSSDWSSDVCSSDRAELGIGVSLVAIAATFALLYYQRLGIARTRSVAIEADNVHYQSDLLLNLSVIAALVLDQYLGVAAADPVFGIAIALWLAWGAFRASSHAIDQLMDKEWPEDKRRRFVDRKSTRLNSSHYCASRMPSSA